MARCTDEAPPWDFTVFSAVNIATYFSHFSFLEERHCRPREALWGDKVGRSRK